MFGYDLCVCVKIDINKNEKEKNRWSFFLYANTANELFLNGGLFELVSARFSITINIYHFSFSKFTLHISYEKRTHTQSRENFCNQNE